ncbi:MAG: hypothetical protein M1819_004164 [Sarea resinae]|nr:MAG: hypothetical protein M1819_004164 [Sarea resinae]
MQSANRLLLRGIRSTRCTTSTAISSHHLRLLPHCGSPSLSRLPQRRHASLDSSPPPPVPQQQSSPHPPPPPPESSSPPPSSPPRPKKSLRPYIYATLFLATGLLLGQSLRYTILPPPLPHAHSPVDALLLAELSHTLSTLHLVRSLRDDPEWREWDAYSNYVTGAERAHRLTTGPLAGARGIGLQKVFFNAAAGQAISVIWFGGGVEGWPGIVHGGVIATVMDESTARVATRGLKGRTGVTANLSLNYRAPTFSNNFYVLRVGPVEEGSTERKAVAPATLETLDGKVCVEARGLFVVPKDEKVAKSLGEIPEGF